MPILCILMPELCTDWLMEILFIDRSIASCVYYRSKASNLWCEFHHFPFVLDLEYFDIFAAESQKQGSIDDYSKGFMHDGPDVYMKEGKKKSEYESSLADSLLKSLQNPAASDSRHPTSSSYVRISSTGAFQLAACVSVYLPFILTLSILTLSL